jgi:UDPglucose 6-dehydrogenase
MAEFKVKVHKLDETLSFPLIVESALEAHALVCLSDYLKGRPELIPYEYIEVFRAGKLMYRLSPKFSSAPLRISVVGTGYVGLVTGVGLCHRGKKVVCVDIDEEKLKLIQSRKSPIFEEGLQEMLQSLPDAMFSCTSNLKEAVMGTQATLIAVGTPSMDSGEQYLGHIETVAKELGRILKHKPGHIVIVKSTVIPGTTENLVKRLIRENAGHSDFRLAMVPEFLREGLALEDFLYPFRIVAGVEDDEMFEELKFIHKGFKTTFFKTTISGAEMIKYASNALLATKITFANEIGNLCKQLGIDVYEVMDGVGLDKRIERAFLNAGRGFGGSCFPKDVMALIYLGKRLKTRARLLEAVWDVNQAQADRLVELAKKRVGLLKNKAVAVMGLAFKPGTDDVRESPAIRVISRLQKEGAHVMGYDPVAEQNMRKHFPKLEYISSPEEIIRKADVVIGVTEWPELRDESLYKGKVFIDGMKFLNKKTGKDYEGICW